LSGKTVQSEDNQINPLGCGPATIADLLNLLRHVIEDTKGSCAGTERRFAKRHLANKVLL
jgi:hypothetical protein